MKMRLDCSQVLRPLLAGALLLACSADDGAAGAGPVPEPEVEPDVRAFLREYDDVRSAAAEMKPDDFLATYAQPEFVSELGYDPASAASLDAIAQKFEMSDPQHQVLAEEGFVVMASDRPVTPEFVYHLV